MRPMFTATSDSVFLPRVVYIVTSPGSDLQRLLLRRAC